MTIMVDDLKKIYAHIKNFLGVELEGSRGFIEFIIKIFLIILIIMSTARIGSVLFNQFIPPVLDLQVVGNSIINKTDEKSVIFYKDLSVKSHNVAYIVKYENIEPDRLSFNLTRDEESFAYVINLYNPSEPGQINIPNLVENVAIAQNTNQPLKPFSVHREFTVNRKKFDPENFYNKLSFNFIKNEIGMLLFLIILINIYSLVPRLIEYGDGKTDKKPFCNLILASLILALILTLSPEGDIGDIKLNISLGSAISAFLMIISFILVYLFKDDYIENWLKK